MAAIAEVFEQRVRHGSGLAAGIAFGVASCDLDKLLGFGDGHGAQHHRVDEPEDRGVRADTEPQRQNGRREKARLAPQHPQGIAEVHEEIVKPDDAPDVAARFAMPQRGPKCSPRFLRIAALCEGFRKV